MPSGFEPKPSTYTPRASIRTSDVQGWVSGLGLSPSTTAVVYGNLAAILSAAAEDRLIARSPCKRRMRLPRAEGAEIQPMTAEQVRALVGAVGDRYKALLVLLAGTGLRPGEALGLTRDRVDFLRRTVRVDRQLITLANAAPQFGPLKTAASVRTIPAPEAAITELAAHVSGMRSPRGR